MIFVEVEEIAMRAVLDITDTAYYLHLSEGAIRALVKLGQIPYKQLGKMSITDMSPGPDHFGSLR